MTIYRAKGCNWYSSCLDCPMPVCRYDVGPDEAIRMKRRTDDARVYRRILELSALPKDQMVKQVALEFGKHKRTVYRIIHRAPEGI